MFRTRIGTKKAVGLRMTPGVRYGASFSVNSEDDLRRGCHNIAGRHDLRNRPAERSLASFTCAMSSGSAENGQGLARSFESRSSWPLSVSRAMDDFQHSRRTLLMICSDQR